MNTLNELFPLFLCWNFYFLKMFHLFGNLTEILSNLFLNLFKRLINFTFSMKVKYFETFLKNRILRATMFNNIVDSFVEKDFQCQKTRAFSSAWTSNKIENTRTKIYYKFCFFSVFIKHFSDEMFHHSRIRV